MYNFWGCGISSRFDVHQIKMITTAWSIWCKSSGVFTVGTFSTLVLSIIILYGIKHFMYFGTYLCEILERFSILNTF